MLILVFYKRVEIRYTHANICIECFGKINKKLGNCCF